MSKALKIILIILAALAVLIAGLFFLLHIYSAQTVSGGEERVLVFAPKEPDTAQKRYMKAVEFDRETGILTVRITNNSDRDFSFGRGYELYEKTDGKWVRFMPPPDWAVPAEECVIPAHSDGGADCDLTVYMEPDSGEYKIAIENLETEFNLEWTE